MINIEFIASTINQKSILKEEKLAEAFKAFDKDGSGKISASEIYSVLNVNEKDEKKKIDDAIKQYDINHDGEIDMDEFISMMSKVDLDL